MSRRPSPHGVSRAMRVVPHLGIPVVLVLVVLSVGADGYARYLATTVCIAYILTASFNLVFGYGGIFSLASVALYGVGAYASVYAENTWGWSFWVAAPFAVVLTAALGAAIAWPTAKLRSIFIAMVTLALAVTLLEVFGRWTSVTGGAAGIYSIEPPTLGEERLVGGTVEYLWLCACVVWIVAEAMLRLHVSPFGRKLAALRETPGVLPSVGVDAARLRLLTFAVSSALAGLAGALYAHFQLTIAPEAFGMSRLIELLLAAVIGGAGTFIGPVVGVAVILGLDEVGILLGGVQPFVYGIAVMILMTFGPKGIAGWLADLRKLVSARLRAEHPSPPPVSASPFAGGLPAAGDRGDPVLVVRDVQVRFGGVHAVRGVSLTVAPGEIVGLIGPNGAGKTSLLNAITAEVPLRSGTIDLGGRSLVGRTKQDIRRSGIARTFQVPALVPDLSLVDNVMLGGETHSEAGFVRQLLYTRRSRRDDHRHRERAHGFLRLVGLGPEVGGTAGEQPYGVLRLAEIARGLMLEPSVFLLDEPGAGLTEADLEELTHVLKEMRDRGQSVIVIDHHVGFVAEVSDRLVVMDQGTVLSEGSPELVVSDPAVIEAYLGEVTVL